MSRPPALTTVLGCSVTCTCESHPEQYEVFLDGKQIGYLRLRGGYFRADWPECGGKTVYHTDVRGHGQFEDDNTRAGHVYWAVRALLDEEAAFKLKNGS